MGSFSKPKVTAQDTQGLSMPEHTALRKLDEFIDAMNVVIEANAVANDHMFMDDITRSVSRLSRAVMVAAACRLLNLRLDAEEVEAPGLDDAQPITVDVTSTHQ
jgi:hypothetical protein